MRVLFPSRTIEKTRIRIGFLRIEKKRAGNRLSLKDRRCECVQIFVSLLKKFRQL